METAHGTELTQAEFLQLRSEADVYKIMLEDRR
jgi:hypothetical protein